jgi:hypothetical protein
VAANGNDFAIDDLSFTQNTSLCATNATMLVTVNPLPTATIYSQFVAICLGGSSWVYIIGTPNATVTYTENWGPNQTIVLDATGTAFLIYTPSFAFPYPYTYTLVSVTSNGTSSCTQSLSGSATIDVIPLPTATISGTTTICPGTSATVTFTGTPNAIVTYTENGGPNQTIVLDATGTSLITPSLFANSTYTLVSVTSNGAPSCTQSLSGVVVITVNPNIEPTFPFQSFYLCQGQTGPILQTTSSNGIPGTWSPAVISTNEPGAWTYTFTPTAGVCASPVDFISTVQPLIIPAFNSISPICEGSPPPTLPSMSLNGIDGTWNPPSINTNIVGTQTYIFTPYFGYCTTYSTSINISVVPSTSSTATISSNPSICLGENATINFNGTPNATVTYNVNGGTNQTILLNANGNANLSANLTSTTTYSLVNVSLNGGCITTLSGSATINVSSPPVINSPSPYIVCDENQDGYSSFDLINYLIQEIIIESGMSVTFHETLLESQIGINPISIEFPYYNISPFSQNLYIRVFYTNSGCDSSNLLQLIVNPSPISPILNNLTACDNDSNPNDGMTIFNLTTQNQAIFNANPNCQNCVLSYHLSQSLAQSNGISIPNPTSYNGTNGQVIWFRIANSNGCYNFGVFELQTSSVFTVYTPTTFNKCDSDASPNNGFTNFDLTTKDNEIKSGCTTCSVYYYPSNTDAINNTNIISNPNNYTNSVASVQSLGVRVVNTGGCIVNTILTIRVTPMPIPNTNPPALSPQCENTPGSGLAVFDLTTTSAYILNGNSSYTLHYYRNQADAIAGSNEITNPTACLIGSTAWIKVTNNFGCYVLVQQPLSVISFPANYATPSNVNSCSPYSLPYLPNGLNYYTGSNGTGTMIPNGTIINTSQIIYIYQQQCNSQSSFNITIIPNITPTVDIIQPSCNMSVGQVQVTSPLGPQYEYSLDWDNFQTSPNFTVLTPGEHYLIVHLVQSDCYSDPIIVTINSIPTIMISGTNNICTGETANLYFYGTPNATVVFNANNGPNQSILIDNSGFAEYTSAPLTTNTSYNLVSITSGSIVCNQNLGNPVLVTVTTCIPNSGFHLNAFLDNNNNGIQDTGEVNVPFGQFYYQVNNITHNIFSFSGIFDITENNPSTLYSFGFTINSAFSNYFIVNPSTYTNMQISSTGGITNINFAISISSFTDLSITNIPLSEPIPGFNYQHMLLYSNNGLLSASGNINFIKDPAVSMVNVSEPSALINSNGFTYNFTNLPPLQNGTIIATMYVPVIPIVNLGQLLITSASINSTSGGDAIPSNNTSSSYQFVVGSYDPNDIIESHGRNILYSSFSSEDYLYYTIRFENTGNANAINISIDNLLDSKLDESTLEMVSSSHNYIMDRISNTVNWKFNNIQLPPSVSNSNVGKGYVMYKIKPKAGYEVGDIIPNTAEIYFDTNPAVVTNTFENEFVSQLSIPEYSNNTITVYPNPAKEQITIQMSPTTFIKQIQLIDMLGRIIKTEHFTSSNTTATLYLNEVAKGTYFIEVISDTNQKGIKKILVN